MFSRVNPSLTSATIQAIPIAQPHKLITTGNYHVIITSATKKKTRTKSRKTT